MSLQSPRMSVFTFQSAVHSGRVLRCLDQQRQRDLLCDVTVVVEGSSFRGHSAVLAACSDYFHARITRQDLVIVLPDEVTVEGFEPLLQFAYTSKLLFTKENIQAVHTSAEILGFHNLETACFDFLVPKFCRRTPENKQTACCKRRLPGVGLGHDVNRDPNPTLTLTQPQYGPAAHKTGSDIAPCGPNIDVAENLPESPTAVPSSGGNMPTDFPSQCPLNPQAVLSRGQEPFSLRSCGSDMPALSLCLPASSGGVCPGVALPYPDDARADEATEFCDGDMLDDQGEVGLVDCSLPCELPITCPENITAGLGVATARGLDRTAAQTFGDGSERGPCGSCPLNMSGLGDGDELLERRATGAEGAVAVCLADPPLPDLGPEPGYGERSSVEREVAEHLAKGFWPDLCPSVSEALPLEPMDPSSLEPMDPSSLEPMDPSSLEPMDPSSLGAMDPSSLGPMDPSSLEPMDPSSLEPMDPSSLEPMDPSSLGPMDPSSLGAMDPSSLGPMDPSSLEPMDPSSLGKAADFHWLKQLDLSSSTGDCPFLRDLGAGEAEVGTPGPGADGQSQSEKSPYMSSVNSEAPGPGTDSQSQSEKSPYMSSVNSEAPGPGTDSQSQSEKSPYMSSVNSEAPGPGTDSLSQSEKSPYMSSVEESDLDTDGDTETNNRRAQEVQLPFAVQQIPSLSRSAFQLLLRRQHLTPDQLELVHDVRRRSKNRVAAQRCRKRKLDSIHKLEAEINTLRGEKEKLMVERVHLKHSMEEILQSLSGLCHSVCSESGPEPAQLMAKLSSPEFPISALLTPLASPSAAHSLLGREGDPPRPLEGVSDLAGPEPPQPGPETEEDGPVSIMDVCLDLNHSI